MSSGRQQMPQFGGTSLPTMSFGQSPVANALSKPAPLQAPTLPTEMPQTQPQTRPQQPMQRPMVSDVQRQQMQQYRDFQQSQFEDWRRQQAPIYENVDSIDVGITGVGGRREAAPMSLQDMRGLWRKGAWR